MTKKNVKTVQINIPNINVLNKIKTTPALDKLSRLDLKVGVNKENVNHYQFFNLNRMFSLIGATVQEITN